MSGGKGSNPGLEAFRKFQMHVGNVIGKQGAIAMKVASIYKNRVKSEGKSSVEVMKEAQKLFDKENEAQHEKVMEKARQMMAEKKRQRKAKKQSKC